MTLTGHSLIAGQTVAGEGKTTFGFNPATNEPLEPAYTLLTEEQLATATTAAGKPSPPSAPWTRKPTPPSWSPSPTTSKPSATNCWSAPARKPACPPPGCSGERARTTGQLRLFAAVVRQGDFRGVRIDPALPGPGPAAPRGHPPAADPAGPGGRVRRQQLPAGLFDGGRRHRLGPRRRLPRGLQGPQRPPRHQRTRGPGHRQSRPGQRPAPRRVLADLRPGLQHRPGPRGRPRHQGRRASPDRSPPASP